MPVTLVKGAHGMATLSTRLLVPTAQGRSCSLGKYGPGFVSYGDCAGLL